MTAAPVTFKNDPRFDGLDYHALNALLNLYGPNGEIQFDADKRAAREYFLNHVNTNTVYFGSLEEKLGFLFDENYYEKPVFDQYRPEFVKGLFKQVYAHRFRFATFLGAFKAYTSYVLKTFDGKRYLERWEDRVTVTALYLARGDEKLASKLADEIILGRFQPATPTILNAGKAQRGELVSCFEAGTPISTPDGPRPIESIVVGDLVLTHNNRHMPVTATGSRLENDEFVTLDIAGVARPLRGTGEHPVLVSTKRDIASVHDGDGAEDGLKWVSLRDVRPGDYVFLGATDLANSVYDTVNVMDYLPSSTSVAWTAEKHIGLVTVDQKNNAAKGDNISRQAADIRGTLDLTEGFGRLVGYYLSQGYVHRTNGAVKGIRLTFGSERVRDIEDAVQQLTYFGHRPIVRENGDGSTSVSLWSRLVGEFFEGFVGTGFDKKRLSAHIKTETPREFLWGLLVGILRGDGCTVPHGVKMALSNPGLVHDVADVLLSLGGVPMVREFVSASGAPTAEVTIAQGADVNTELVYAIDRDIEKFVPSASPNTTLHKRIINGRAAYRVREVSFEAPAEPIRVYNLEVEEDHTYVASRVIVHNCFLLRVEDNMESIARGINSALQLSKRGGGVALNLSNIREHGAPIKHIENQSSGVIPVMKLLEDSFSYANQLGARQGAGAVYLSAHHPDIMRFLDTKRENADEKIRIKTLSLGIVVPDITFELAKRDEDMYLFSPYDVERVYGVPFGDISVSEKYREMVDDARIKKTKISAREFFQTVAELQFESGYPYVVFEDTVNRANAIDGRINMSNLCSEILQVNTPSTYRDDLGYEHVGKDISCNLGSLNIAKAIRGGDLGGTVEAAIRALTAVSDLSDISAVPSIANGNSKSHAIGLGQMNLHGFLGSEHIHYDSPEAIDFTSAYFATVAYHALRASNLIAAERGEAFDGFERSKYAPQEDEYLTVTVNDVKQPVGAFFEKYLTRSWKPQTDTVKALFRKYKLTVPSKADWAALAAAIAQTGLYNQNLQAVPPTGSISYINDSTASIHPVASAIEIRKEGKLGRVYFPAPGLDQDNLEYFRDAYEIGPEAIIDVYAAATEHVDQGLSLTLFFKDTATTRDINRAQIYAWRKGIKSIYYARIRQMALEGTEISGCVSCAL